MSEIGGYMTNSLGERKAIKIMTKQLAEMIRSDGFHPKSDAIPQLRKTEQLMAEKKFRDTNWPFSAGELGRAELSLNTGY